MRFFLISLLLLPSILFAQEPIFKKGIPNDLDTEKIIFLEHEKIKVTANRKDGKAAKYLHLRQTNHNKVIDEANIKLQGAALSYPYKYAITTPSTYSFLVKAGYKYVLRSNVYSYDHLKGQPNDNELLVFEYFIHDVQNNVAYKVFQMDEMKVYDFKSMIRKLNRSIKKN